MTASVVVDRRIVAGATRAMVRYGRLAQRRDGNEMPTPNVADRLNVICGS
jgi:hypothetical protein